MKITKIPEALIDEAGKEVKHFHYNKNTSLVAFNPDTNPCLYAIDNTSERVEGYVNATEFLEAKLAPFQIIKFEMLGENSKSKFQKLFPGSSQVLVLSKARKEEFCPYTATPLEPLPVGMGNKTFLKLVEDWYGWEQGGVLVSVSDGKKFQEELKQAVLSSYFIQSDWFTTFWKSGMGLPLVQITKHNGHLFDMTNSKDAGKFIKNHYKKNHFRTGIFLPKIAQESTEMLLRGTLEQKVLDF